MDLVGMLAPYFKRYITIGKGISGQRYDYAKRGMFGLQVVDAVLHLPKCSAGEEWLYVAVPEGADLSRLRDDQRLYVGSQKGDRMFRGDGLKGANFHHAQMRKGKGGRNLIAYLDTVAAVEIYRIGTEGLETGTREVIGLHRFERLLREPKLSRSHTGHRFEQAILSLEPGRWAWNTAPADSTMVAFVRELSI